MLIKKIITIVIIEIIIIEKYKEIGLLPQKIAQVMSNLLKEK